MGHRANLVIVDEAGYQLYYCHWCAISIPTSIFWGPEIALEFIRQQCPVDADEKEWLDTVWAEGGVLVDIYRQQALLYGGEELPRNIPLRRLYMALAQQVWTGWNIQWASGGIVSMAGYVGLPLEVVCKPMEKPRGKCELPAPAEMDWVDTIGSIRRKDGTIDFFPTEIFLANILPHGPSLVKAMHRKKSLTEYQCDELPQSGFHIDETEKTLSYWTIEEEFIRETELIPLWPDWDVVPLHDDFEAHIRLTDGRFKVTLTPEEELLSQLKSMLLAQPMNLAENFLDVVGRLEEEGENVEINSYALRDSPLELAEGRRREILDEAIKAWRKSKGD